MKAWNYIKNDCDQETGQGIIIVRDDRGKAIAWRSVSCKKTCIRRKNSIILSLHFAPSLQSAVYILYWPDRYCCFCSSEPQVQTEILELVKNNFSETILTAMIDEWTVCWRAPDEKDHNRAMITLYQQKTNANARLTEYGCFWCSSAWSQRVLKWTRNGSPRYEHFGFLISSCILEVRKCDLKLLFLLNHTNILFLSMWVSEPHRN